jgi:chromosome segregation ATPase
MNQQIHLALVACLALAPACASLRNDQPEPIDDSLVAELSGSAMEDIRDLRRESDKQSDELARAERRIESAEARAEAVESELKAAQQNVEAAEIRVENARERGTTENLEQAQEDLDEAKRRVQNARNELEWRRQEITEAEALAELQRERQELAKARLEFAKAEAIKDLDRPEANRIDVEAYRRLVREQQTQVELAEVKANAAKEEVSRMEASFKRDGGEVREDREDREEREDRDDR